MKTHLKVIKYLSVILGGVIVYGLLIPYLFSQPDNLAVIAASLIGIVYGYFTGTMVYTLWKELKPKKKPESK